MKLGLRVPQPLHSRACAPQKQERLSPGVPCAADGSTALPESHTDVDGFYLKVFYHSKQKSSRVSVHGRVSHIAFILKRASCRVLFSVTSDRGLRALALG